MIQEVPSIDFVDKLQSMRTYFKTGATRSYTFRKEQLLSLKRSVLNHEENLYEALYADLKKSKEESWVTETGLLIAEINTALKNLHASMRPQKAGTNLLNLKFPAPSS